MIDVLLATFFALNVLWVIVFPVALLTENKSWVGVIESIFGRAPTNGILVRNALCLWFWPIALIMSTPKILKWMKQPR